ncbi:hypothetical protein [Paraglaciecola sp. MB-3u-78]|jgi:hypothetical protein|uniref:hypothetical protein n=1 Tax=Paraglaciecola sp. MB-3u-78 TaxID=2058332 RepID=UPI0012FEFA6E|nr:hypothetical protein [Paraglaciecola sp. MB-3u-78]
MAFVYYVIDLSKAELIILGFFLFVSVLPLGAEDEFAAQGIYAQYSYIDPDQS